MRTTTSKPNLVRNTLRRILAVLTLLASVATAVHSAEGVCELPSDVDYRIDLATGRTSGALSRGLDEQIRILLFNRNPLRDYEIGIAALDLPEPALDLVPKLFPHAAGLLSADPETVSNAKKLVAGASPEALDNLLDNGLRSLTSRDPAAICSVAVAAAARTMEINAAKNEVIQAISDAETAFLKFEVALTNAIKDSSSKENALYAKAPCATLVKSLTAYKDALGWPTVNTALNASRDLSGKLGDGKNSVTKPLSQALSKFEQAGEAASCELAFKDAAAPVRATLSLAAGSRSRLTHAMQGLAKETKALEDEDQKIAALLADPSRFYTIPPSVGRYMDPTEVTVTIRSKSPKDASFPAGPDASAVLNFGGRQRFAFAIGAAFSSLDAPEYDDVTSFALDESGLPISGKGGVPVPERVLSLTDDSDSRISPLVVLHTRLRGRTTSPMSVHASLGVTARLDGDNSGVEYLMGLSGGFAQERFFVTVGLYNGRVQKINEGFRVGTVLPPEITELPIRKDREWAPAIGLSYKFR